MERMRRVRKVYQVHKAYKVCKVGKGNVEKVVENLFPPSNLVNFVMQKAD